MILNSELFRTNIQFKIDFFIAVRTKNIYMCIAYTETRARILLSNTLNEPKKMYLIRLNSECS